MSKNLNHKAGSQKSNWRIRNIIPYVNKISMSCAMLMFMFVNLNNSVQGQEDPGKTWRELEGEWLYAEDITPGRTTEKHGPPMSVRIILRAVEDGLIHARPRGDERITLDGAVIKKDNNNGSHSQYSGVWKNGELVYSGETIRNSNNTRSLLIVKKFRKIPNGLKVSVAVNNGKFAEALYLNPNDIPLPNPAPANISDMKWLESDWTATQGTRSMEERWGPPSGGSMLGVSRTVSKDKMVAFEFLRIVERDGGLVYIAQPGGKPPTEFVLTELLDQKAVFINPRHDYPQRIVYQLSDEGTLTASIGFAKGGRLRGFSYHRENSQKEAE